MSTKAFQILLVEDNPGDIRLTKEAFKTSKIQHKLDTVENGTEALNYLHRVGPYANATRPDLVLLDLNLPGKDGREVLVDIKADKTLRRIPVIILTSSRAQEDISHSYDLQANCYITKPASLQAFMDAIRQIETFWFTVARLPS